MKALKVLITGACGGLGAALAKNFAQHGADLLLMDKSGKMLDSLSRSLEEAGFQEPGVCPLDFSVAGIDAYSQLAKIVRDDYGRLDILIHCAASFYGLQPLEHISPNQWHEMLQVNLSAPWMLTTACMPALKSSPAGKVVFVLEEEQIYGQAYRGAYAAAKAGLSSLAGTFAQEVEGSTVTVLKFQPPPMRTDLRARAYHSEDPSMLRDPDEIAHELFLDLTKD